MLIKVCGMRDAQNIRDVSELDIDMMGFNFWQQSKRYVLPEEVKNLVLPEHIKKVGLFVDETPLNIASIIKECSLDYVQLHGSESQDMIKNLRDIITSETKVIKAFGISSKEDLAQTKTYDDIADMFIFDYKSPGRGGSGKHFDWSILEAYKGNTPFLLSGGIGPEDAEAVMSFHHPMYVGVDINSKFETSPAMKDVEKLRNFVKTIKDNE